MRSVATHERPAEPLAPVSPDHGRVSATKNFRRPPQHAPPATQTPHGATMPSANSHTPAECTATSKSEEEYIPDLTVVNRRSSQRSVEHEVALGSGEDAAGSSVKHSRKNHRLFVETDVSRWTRRKREGASVSVIRFSHRGHHHTGRRKSHWSSQPMGARARAGCERRYNWADRGYPDQTSWLPSGLQGLGQIG